MYTNIWHGIILGYFYIHNTCLHIYMYFWVGPYPIKRGCTWRVELGVGRWAWGPRACSSTDVLRSYKCWNESVNGSQTLGEIFSLYCVPSWTIFFKPCVCIIAFVVKLKYLKICCSLLLLCPFACSVSSAPKVSFPSSLSSTIFPGGSGQRLPLCGHPSLFWMHGFLALFVPHECRILLCSVLSVFLVWWVRALWSGMVWLIRLSPKATKSLSL